MPSSRFPRIPVTLSFLLLGLAACQPASSSSAEVAAAAADTAQAEAPDASPPASAAAAADTTPLARLRGQVSYPSEYVPAMRVCAIAADDPGTGHCGETAQNAPDFDLAVPAGDWWLLAWPLDEAAGDPGVLSNASDCIARADIGCDDHALAAITVTAGETREGLAINDWYYDPREFPPPMQPRPALR